MDIRSDLVRHEAYAAIETSRVELRETHISWVFLLDRDVFKVKKPVELGFLDFRTLDRRKAACEAEVHLNERLAPGTYLGVVPVRQEAQGRCAIGGNGPIVDWAVHMARLPDDVRADTLLAGHTLTPEAVDGVAGRLAAFHASARNDASMDRFGTPEAIATNVEENFAQTKDIIDRYLRPGEAEELVRWQRAFVGGHGDLFAARAAAGRIRDGHGDLRLEHVYLPAGAPPVIIDCIEFNERFRIGDTCADIAFLSMDLAAHGRVDLAERFLARYAREANDFDLYALVDFYESYRAFVRAKIAAIVAADDRFDPEARQESARDARRHFLLALSFERQSLALPAVIAVGGVIASGKSTVADRIGAELSAPIVDADRTRKSLLGVQPTQPIHDPAWQGAYDPAFTRRVYDEVLRRAEVVLRSRRPVVVDASFREAPMRAAVQALAQRHAVPFRFVECRADPEVCRARLRARSGAVSDGRADIFDAFAAKMQPVVELSPEDHIVLDTSEPLERNVARLRERIDVWPAGFAS
jgi:aminoglycoside phosphotransferase family enzyme/predicted kinase